MPPPWQALTPCADAPNRTAFTRLLAWLRQQNSLTQPVHEPGRGSANLANSIEQTLRACLVLHGEVSPAALHDLQ